MLSSAIKNRTKAITYGITPKGSRPPFTRKYSAAEAMQWWMQHRYDQLGMGLVASMTPMQVAQLDAWLAQVSAHPSMQQGQAPAAAPAAAGNSEWALKQAIGQERRIQGPPIGSEVA